MREPIYMNVLKALQVESLYDSVCYTGKWYERYTTRQSRCRSLKNKKFK